MRSDHFGCVGFLSALFLLACGNSVRAQSTSIVLTNASVRGSDFSFEIIATDLAGCVIEAANAPSGGWAELLTPVANPFVVRADSDARFFRVRCGDAYSTNLAGYIARVIPSSFSMVANPLSRGANTVAELFANPPSRTVLYKFDAARQVWSGVTEFEFGAWTWPAETLNPGEGAFLYSPFPFRQVFAGVMSNNAVFPQLKGGWNLVSLPSPTVSVLPRPEPNDRIILYNQINQYRVFEWDGGSWDAEPDLDWTESFWYYRNEPNPQALPQHGTLYFNNYAPSVDAPFAGPDGKRLEGTNWLAQLYGSSLAQVETFSAIGSPLPFLTGAGAGYFDTSSGALRMMPFTATTGERIWVQARMWESRAGSSYEEAVAHGGAHGTSQIVSAFAGGSANPPVPPGAADFNPIFYPLDGSAWPTNQVVFAGVKARFSAQNTPNVSYQWQRLVEATNWTDIPDARLNELVFDPVAPQSEGSYRLQTSYQGVTNSGRPVHLRVLPSPQFTALTYVPSNGALQFRLNAEAGVNYRLEASAGLTNWLYLSTLDNFGGSQQIADIEAGSFRERFYRLVIAGP